MDTGKEARPTSFFSGFARRLGDFARAVDMRPVDYLEIRVANLERRLAELLSEHPDSSQSNTIQSARKV